MKLISLAALVLLLLIRPALGANAGESENFDLTPVPVADPALKYELLFGPADQRPGNAALLYGQALMFVNDSFADEINHADDLLYQPDSAAFLAAASKFKEGATLGLLDLAGRCEDSDWGIPARELGMNALLPNLNHMRVMENLLHVVAVYRMRTGDVPGALNMIRPGLELGRDCGREPFLVSGLVGVGILRDMSEAIGELMSRPDSPNLYWALAGLPHPMMDFHKAMEHERISISSTFHDLNTDRLQDLSADQWKSIFKGLVAILNRGGGNAPASQQGWASDQTVADEVTRNLPEARDYYARTFGVSADEAEQVDPFKAVAIFWYGQYEEIVQQQYAISTLPYPMQIALIDPIGRKLSELKSGQPANVFVAAAPTLNRAALTFARCDRVFAALTDVEAIRSWAAAHGGALPDSLQQITDTPALDNPRTDKPFDYKVANGTATLSDPLPENLPLTYTIRIRH